MDANHWSIGGAISQLRTDVNILAWLLAEQRYWFIQWAEHLQWIDTARSELERYKATRPAPPIDKAPADPERPAEGPLDQGA